MGLSITVPWVLPAERGVQKRLYTGTVVGKVNAADSLSLALVPCLFIHSFSLRHTLYLSFSIFLVLFSSRCLSFSLRNTPPTPHMHLVHMHSFFPSQREKSIAGELSCPCLDGVWWCLVGIAARCCTFRPLGCGVCDCGVDRVWVCVCMSHPQPGTARTPALQSTAYV